jgi:cyclase
MKCLIGVVLAVAAFAQQNEPFEVVKVRPNIYMLASLSGNVTVQLGDAPGHDGVLLVDSGTVEMTDRIMAEIHKLSDKPIRYILNTSADARHVGGNAIFARSNASGPAAVFAQDNTLLRMSEPASQAPQQGWPTITFEDRKDCAFNGESIQMFAEKRAHTDGDSIVHFRRSNVVATGDVFLTTGYPVIDL